MLPEIRNACGAMEECYECMLAYAAQGLPTDQGSQSGARVRDCLARAELVLAQPSISSQLIDNLNASIHLRALLTDLFLLTEVGAETRERPLPVVTEATP